MLLSSILSLLISSYICSRSNNPFAPQSPISPSPSSPQSPPHFNKQGTYESSTSPSLSPTSPGSPPPGSPQNQGSRPFTVKTRLEENQELANLFADREGGQDTFGNTGLLRFVLFHLSISLADLLSIDMVIPTQVVW